MLSTIVQATWLLFTIAGADYYNPVCTTDQDCEDQGCGSLGVGSTCLLGDCYAQFNWCHGFESFGYKYCGDKWKSKYRTGYASYKYYTFYTYSYYYQKPYLEPELDDDYVSEIPKLSVESVHVAVQWKGCALIEKWAETFTNESGIDISIHCYTDDLGSTLLKDDITKGDLGGMDVVLGPTVGHTVDPTSLKNLGSYISSSAINWGNVVPVVRDFILTSGERTIGIPVAFNWNSLQHRRELTQLSGVLSWDEYIKEVKLLHSVDEDGDGSPDNKFCINADEQSFFKFVSTSFLQTHGNTDSMDTYLRSEYMWSLAQTDGMVSSGNTFRELLNMATPGVSSENCSMLYGTVDPRTSFQPTLVGSPVVFDKKAWELQDAATASPYARPTSKNGSIIVNLAMHQYDAAYHVGIVKKSSHVEEAWEFIEYMQQDYVVFSFLLQGLSNPYSLSQLRATTWIDQLELLKTTHAEKIVEADNLKQMASMLTTTAGISAFNDSLAFYTTEVMDAHRIALQVLELFQRIPAFKCVYHLTYFDAAWAFDALNDGAQPARRWRSYYNVYYLQNAPTAQLELLRFLRLPYVEASGRQTSGFTECALGAYRTSVSGSICKPCAPGYYDVRATMQKLPIAEVTKMNQHGLEGQHVCQPCPNGQYQTMAGSLYCYTCPKPFTTIAKKATSKAECVVAQLDLNPTYPDETPVQLVWSLDSFNTPDQEDISVQVDLVIFLAWRDDRLIYTADGTQNTENWLADGKWAPSVAILSQTDESKTVFSDYVNVSRTALGGGLYIVECQRAMSVRATLSWDNLDWLLFPHGTHTLNIKIECETGARCAMTPEDTGRRELGDVERVDSCSTPSGSCLPVSNMAALHQHERRLAVKGSTGSAAVAQASTATGVRLPSGMDDKVVSDYAEDNWPSNWPLLEVIGPLGSDNVFRISIVVNRAALLFIIRLVLPTVVVVALVLALFYGEDSSQQLEYAFMGLLIVMVLQDQVSGSLPSHVTYMTLIDYIFLGNFILLCVAAVSGLLVLVGEQRDMHRHSSAVDASVKWTQIPCVLVFNGVMHLIPTGKDVPIGFAGAIGAAVVLQFIVFILQHFGPSWRSRRPVPQSEEGDGKEVSSSIENNDEKEIVSVPEQSL